MLPKGFFKTVFCRITEPYTQNYVYPRCVSDTDRENENGVSQMGFVFLIYNTSSSVVQLNLSG